MLNVNVIVVYGCVEYCTDLIGNGTYMVVQFRLVTRATLVLCLARSVTVKFEN